MTCDNCGSKYLEINKYKIKGKDEKGRHRQRTVSIQNGRRHIDVEELMEVK